MSRRLMVVPGCCLALIASMATGATLTWTGGAGNSKWATAANWSPAQVPASGDNLQFPTPTSATFNNDLPVTTSLRSVTLNGGTVTGNTIVFTTQLYGSAPTTVNVAVRPSPNAAIQNLILAQPIELPGGDVRLEGWATEAQGGVTGGGRFRGRGTVFLAGTPSFTGTADVEGGALTLVGNMPNGDVRVDVGGQGAERILLGNGNLRDLSSGPMGVIAPGPPGSIPGDLPISPGSFTVANLALAGRTQFVIDSAAASQLRVNGTASLGGTITLVLKPGFTPAVGQGFRVVDKLSAGSLSGTFSNAPAEGSTFSSAGFTWSVTYAGGSGNDVDVRVVAVALRTQPASLGWIGSAGDHKWSTAANWRPTLVPQAGDDLGIGYDVDVTNDLPAYTIFNSLIAGNATVRGNAISITTAFGSVDVRHLDRPTFKVPVRVVGTRVMLKNAALDAPLEMTGGTVWIHSAAYLNDGITGAGTIEGGPVVGGTSSFTGTFRDGGVVAMGSLPAAKVIDGPVLGTGLIGEVTEGTSWTIAPSVRDEDSWNPVLPGTLTIGKLQLAGTLDLLFTSGGTSKLKITQSITLNEATLAISTKSGFTSTGGSQYTVVDNTTSGPIVGSFKNARDGSVITVGNKTFRVSYSGGDGNDIVLTDISCTLSMTVVPNTFGTAGGNGTVSVTASAPGCPWALASSGSWLHFNGSGAGAGSGAVSFTVDANTGAARSTNVTLSNTAQVVQTAAVSQAALVCNYVMAPSSGTYDSRGGNDSFDITVANGCTWTATSNVAWVAVTGNASGNGNGKVHFNIATNTTGAQRQGAIQLSGPSHFAITQLGQSCDYAVNVTGANFSKSGGSGRISIATSPACEWSASSNRAWVTLSKQTGTGPGEIDFTVAPNDSFDLRTASLRIGDQAVAITEAACAALAPITIMPTAAGGTQSSPVRVAWIPVEDAVLYRVWVTDDTGRSTLGAESRDLSTTVALNNGNYKFAVEAVFASCPPTRSAETRLTVGPSRRRAGR